jgi:hypothetical protein
VPWEPFRLLQDYQRVIDLLWFVACHCLPTESYRPTQVLTGWTQGFALRLCTEAVQECFQECSRVI